MSSPVIVVSPDKIRGDILKKILSRGGVDVLWCKSFHEAREAFEKHEPPVVIFDAKGLQAREAGVLEKLRNDLPGAVIFALSDAGRTPVSQAGFFPRTLWFPEPLDPELIVSKVCEIISSPPAEIASDLEPDTDVLTTFLKDFLKLD